MIVEENEKDIESDLGEENIEKFRANYKSDNEKKESKKPLL